MTDPALEAGIEPVLGATAHVHLPRSLVALFPGASRRIDVRGETLAEVIDDLERQLPGIRDRLVDAGPMIRTHLNVYVAGARSTLGTMVAPGSEIHIVPAVSGGLA